MSTIKLQNPDVIYVHKKTVTWRDYGEFLDRRVGLAWSMTGQEGDAVGFEQCDDFDAIVAAKRAKIAENKWQVELRVGAPLARTVDYNPHGLV